MIVSTEMLTGTRFNAYRKDPVIEMNGGDSFQHHTPRVQLQYIKPAIWRRITIEGNKPPSRWSDTHLHDFLIDDQTYAILDVEAGLKFVDPDRALDDRTAKVHKTQRPGSRILIPI